MDRAITLIENALSAQDFIRLRQSVSWGAPSAALLEKAFEHNLYSVAAVADGRVVGMGRLVGDGVVIWYIQDVIIEPGYQGQGLGKAIVERLLDHIREATPYGDSTMVGLMAAKGKEGFYEKLGFHARPDEGHGHGMYLRMSI